MSTLFAFAALLATLDNSVVNDFWDTTAYTNAEPTVTAVAVAAAVDATVPTGIPVTIPEFNSFKPGMVFYVR